MALTLSSASISSGDTIKAAHVTQSVDAFTGAKEYDITISGSLTVIGITNITGSVGVSNDLDVEGTLTAGELELTNLTVNGIADIATANIDAGIISASFTGSLLGTASYVTGSSVYGPFGSNSVISASYAVTSLPGGNNTEIQFNSGSKFHGTSSFTFNYTSQSLQQGFNVTASGIFSHAEGIGTRATGSYSHAEGSSSIAIGNFSHAEGETSIASGSWSHAEGGKTVASGFYAHSEGGFTIARGNYSHAEGLSTIALGVYSHAEGLGTVTSGSYQHAQGQWNTQGDDTSLLIVGNGTSNGNRSDAFKVRMSGSIVLPTTQSAAPSWTGTNGEMVFATISGDHYFYVWMSGAWRSGSLS
jgi:hypothetical protein